MEIFSDSLYSGIHSMKYIDDIFFVNLMSCQNVYDSVLQTKLGHMSAKTPVGSLGHFKVQQHETLKIFVT